MKEKTYSDVKEEYVLLYQKKRLFDLATGVVAGIIGKIIYDNRAKIQKKAVDTVKKVSCNIQ